MPAERERLIAAYDDRAADCYSKVVTRYPMAPHVEDAREKLIALGRPVPEPTQTELAESEAEEQSRANIKLKDRAILLVKHGPSTLEAARVGEPLMTPAKTVTAPEVSKENVAIFNAAAGIKPAAAGEAHPSPDGREWHRRAAHRRCCCAESRGQRAEGTGVGVEILNPNGNAVDNNSGNSSTGAAPPAAALHQLRKALALPRRHPLRRRQLWIESRRSGEHRPAAARGEARRSTDPGK